MKNVGAKVKDKLIGTQKDKQIDCGCNGAISKYSYINNYTSKKGVTGKLVISLEN